MSSDVQSTLKLIQLNNYASLVIVTTVIYDFLITFSREVEYVWRRPWTWVSTIFVLVRYPGLCWAVLTGFFGTTFVPGPAQMSSKGTVMFEITAWMGEIFYHAADLAMILRVYAMWKRSKAILYILLSLYVPQVIISLVFAGISYNPRTYLSVTTVQFLGSSLCESSWTDSTSLDVYAGIPRTVVATALLILAVTQTAMQTAQMYKATKQWHLNWYLQQFVRDGVIYFLVNMFYNIATMLQDYTVISDTSLLFLTLFSYSTICPMMPRFIIGVRELYDRDIRRGLQGIDTGFGVSSQLPTGQITAVSTIAFADAAPEQEQVVEEDSTKSGESMLETLGDDTRQV